MDDWVLSTLRRYQKDGAHVEDCHFIPQWQYASKVDRILPLAGVASLQQFIRALHPSFSNVSMTCDRKCIANRKGRAGPCTQFKITGRCFANSSLQVIKQFYADDYEHLSGVWSMTLAHN